MAIDFLVVEDDKDVLKTTTHYIETIIPGASILTAEDYESAIAKLDEAQLRNMPYAAE